MVYGILYKAALKKGEVENFGTLADIGKFRKWKSSKTELRSPTTPSKTALPEDSQDGIQELREKYGFHPDFKYKKSSALSREEYDAFNREAALRAIADKQWAALKALEVRQFSTKENMKHFKLYKACKKETISSK